MSPRRTWIGGVALALVAALALSGLSRAEDTEGEARARLAALVEQTRRAFPEVPAVSIEDYVALAGTTAVVLVDVREDEERKVSWIPGSVPRREFEENRERYRDLPVVCYCTIGWRSSEYTGKLRKAGWDARNLEGSIVAWALSGRDVQGADGPTRRVHVYGARWNLLPPGWEAVW
jgi:rhodanese-related sulfurtransferase